MHMLKRGCDSGAQTSNVVYIPCIFLWKQDIFSFMLHFQKEQKIHLTSGNMVYFLIFFLIIFSLNYVCQIVV